MSRTVCPKTYQKLQYVLFCLWENYSWVLSTHLTGAACFSWQTVKKKNWFVTVCQMDMKTYQHFDRWSKQKLTNAPDNFCNWQYNNYIHFMQWLASCAVVIKEARFELSQAFVLKHFGGLPGAATISPYSNHYCVILSVTAGFSSSLWVWPFGRAINTSGFRHGWTTLCEDFFFSSTKRTCPCPCIFVQLNLWLIWILIWNSESSLQFLIVPLPVSVHLWSRFIKPGNTRKFASNHNLYIDVVSICAASKM